MDYLKNIFSRFILFYKSKSKRELALFIFFAGIFVWILLQQFAWTPPRSFPVQATIEIPKGTTLYGTAVTLDERGVVRSSFWFKFFVRAFGGSGSVIAGDYFFRKPQNVIDIAWRVTHGKYDLIQLKITIPEGATNSQIAEFLTKQFSYFDSKEFLKTAEEGKMFPDTYFFLPNANHNQIIERVGENFNAKIKSIEKDIASSTHTFDDILIMASILEREAKTKDARQNIADILWRRIEIGMPLQVDATFAYINGKTTETLTLEDLQIDSPYNTYNRLGLPPTPISNPGLEAILDAIYPIENDYLYFLSDKKGNIYYAKDFEGHQINRELYLGR